MSETIVNLSHLTGRIGELQIGVAYSIKQKTIDEILESAYRYDMDIQTVESALHDNYFIHDYKYEYAILIYQTIETTNSVTTPLIEVHEMTKPFYSPVSACKQDKYKLLDFPYQQDEDTENAKFIHWYDIDVNEYFEPYYKYSQTLALSR